jgi:hypothetical protein
MKLNKSRIKYFKMYFKDKILFRIKVFSKRGTKLLLANLIWNKDWMLKENGELIFQNQ